MSERKEGPRPEQEKSFETRLEKAETIAEVLTLVDEIMGSESYANTEEGGDKIALANRTGIQRFGRRAYYEAFEAKFGMAEIYMRPPGAHE